MPLTIVPYFAIKWLKYTRNKGILSIQIMDKCIFFPSFSLFPEKQNQWINILFYYVSPKSCVILLKVVKLVVHILALLNILLIRWLNKLFAHRM